MEIRYTQGARGLVLGAKLFVCKGIWGSDTGGVGCFTGGFLCVKVLICC